VADAESSALAKRLMGCFVDCAGSLEKRTLHRVVPSNPEDSTRLQLVACGKARGSMERVRLEGASDPICTDDLLSDC